MNISSRFRNFGSKKPEPEKLKQMQLELLEESTLEINYLALTVGSCAIATFGLLSNSAAVIIGAMIVAPLMLPIRGLAFASLEGNIVIFRKSATAIVVGTLISIALAWCIGFLVRVPQFGSQVLARSEPTLLDLGIAIAAGAISGFAKVKPKTSSSLAGTAIAVALMPPICVIGLSLSQGDWSLSLGATLLYLTNLLGITLSCMLIFVITGCTSLRRGGKALRRTAIFTSILIIPLTISFVQLWQQEKLEAFVQDVLVNRTATFQRVKLIDTRVNWRSEPPEAYLDVSVIGAYTPNPKQVGLLEDFVAKETGKRFTLIFQVSQVEQVRRVSNKQSSTNANIEQSKTKATEKSSNSE